MVEDISADYADLSINCYEQDKKGLRGLLDYLSLSFG
jgi:hypothetical protein